MKKAIFCLLAGFSILGTIDARQIPQGSDIHEKAVGVQSQYPFSIIPRVIRVGGSTTEIRLAAVLAAGFNATGAEIEAAYKNGKTTYTYSSAIKKFMKAQGLSSSAFKPLEAYLAKQIKSAKADPAPFVSMLDGYLKMGLAPSYTVSIDP